MGPFLPAVAEQLFRDIQKSYQETSQSKKGVAKGDKWLTAGHIFM